MRRLPIAVRVTVVATVALGIALVCTAALFRGSLRRSERAELESSARARLAQTVEMVEAGEVPERLPSPRDSPLMVQVVTDDGTVLGATQNVGDMHVMVTSSTLRTGEVARRSATVDGARVDVFATTAGRTGDVVLVAVPTRSMGVADDRLARELWTFGPIVLLTAALTVWLTARRALRPVERLRGEVASISATDLSTRVSAPDVDDEIGRLAHTMNALLDRLDASATRQSRFVSDASHELRSPLAAVRTRLEVALRQQDTTDWPSLAAGVLTENARMERMVRDLLFLARTDAGAPRAPHIDVDLDDIVLQEIESARTYARVPIDASGVSAARVAGHPDHLRRVVANLLDNAQRHACTMVRARVGVEGDHAVVTVTDDGAGIDPADRERVFERFTRLDDARTRTDGGSGLGLAIVREILHEHGGQVEIGDAPEAADGSGAGGRGTRFTLRFPLPR